MEYNVEMAAGLINMLNRIEHTKKHALNNNKRRRSAKLHKKYARWLDRCRVIGRVSPEQISQYLRDQITTVNRPVRANSLASSIKGGMLQKD